MEVAKIDSGALSVINNAEALETFRINAQNFSAKLNKPPSEESIDKTADGKAKTVTISHIEMLLDEYFFGLWETENFKWSVIANEVVGSLELVVLHPVTGTKLRRTGAASITIMVDKYQGDDGQEKNRWALDIQNKKSNALDMGFPKLKAECTKNAAQSLGKLFGRDINRKKQDNYNPLIKKEKAVAYEDLLQLYTLKYELLDKDEKINAQRIVDNKEANSYNKLFKKLSEI